MNVCEIEGCCEPVKGRGWCAKHYARWIRCGSPHGASSFKTRGKKRSHPLYITWFEKKSAGILCEEWQEFWSFVDAVGDRPSDKHILFRRDTAKIFSPENTYWRENFVYRLPGETKKEHHARKWAHRMKANPGWEDARNLKRKYGLTPDDYRSMEQAQGYVCAICKNPETSVHASTQVAKKLAVDHCHKTGKVRSLLCYRCNTMIGRVDESVELLQAMIDYLKRHE